MTPSPIRFAAAVLGLLLFGAQAQSADCGHRRTATAVLICQTPRLSSRDQEMAYLLKNLRKTLPAGDRRRLNAEQRAWRRHLVSCSKDPDCIADRYDQRIHQLLTVKCLHASRCARW
ncbi:MAG: lysozyme inhibitor LprI family protein [Xanthobacteraceae bacterium]